jgi:hypothetical protein
MVNKGLTAALLDTMKYEQVKERIEILGTIRDKDADIFMRARCHAGCYHDWGWF